MSMRECLDSPSVIDDHESVFIQANNALLPQVPNLGVQCITQHAWVKQGIEVILCFRMLSLATLTVAY